MAKVKIKNICESQCVGFSFKSLKPNQTTVVDEDIITEADKRLLEKGDVAILEAWDGVIDKAPVQRVPQSPEKKTPPKDDSDKKMVTSKDIDPDAKSEEAEEVVTPADIARQKDESAKEEAPAEDTPEEPASEEVPAEDEKADGEEEAKVYTREDLSSMTRDELRTIGKPLGIRGRGVEKLIEDILKAQGNAE